MAKILIIRFSAIGDVAMTIPVIHSLALQHPEHAKKMGKKCLMIDKRSHLGGNIYCEDVDSINVHKYGAHIFHTSNKEVWQFVNSFVEFNRFTNSPLANYKDVLYNLPFNMNTFSKLWGVETPQQAKEKLEEQRQRYAHIETPANLEEQALKLCGDDIYYAFIKEYTEKQWGRSAKELPAFIIKRIPFRFTYDNNYFNDDYQGIPKGGYNKLINGLLEGVEVKLNTNYFDHKAELDKFADTVLFTGRIDELFNYEFGVLEYRSLSFEHGDRCFLSNSICRRGIVISFGDGAGMERDGGETSDYVGDN